MLYKLENGILKKFDGKFFGFENDIYANPTEEQLRKAGYKPIVETEMPECDAEHFCTAVYEETDAEIIRKWEIHEIAEELYT